MNNHTLQSFILRYFANHLSRPLKELYGGTAILTFATSAVAIFEPIYLYRVGVTLPGIFAFYLVVYIGYLLVLPLGAKVARMRGYEQAILFSSPFLILYYLSLAAIPCGATGQNAWLSGQAPSRFLPFLYHSASGSGPPGILVVSVWADAHQRIGKQE